MRALSLIALGAALLSPGSAAGQSRSYDSGTGLYTVTYYSYDLEQDTSVQFEALDKVGPVVFLDSIAVEAPGQFLYVYRVLNDSSVAGTIQRIANIEAPCEGTSGISWPTGWLGWSGNESELVGGGGFCAYTTDVGIAPETELSGFEVATSRSPGIATWYVRAPRPPLNWPDVGEHQETVHDLIEEITGAGGPWATAYAPSPTYAPEEVDPALLQAQLSAVCDDPLWLDDSQLCTEFGDLLDLAEDEEGDGNLYGAAAVLGRLKDRVGEEQASMEANAFWLLSLNAAQVESNALESASAVADRWQVLTSHGPLSGSWELSDTTQSQGAISGTMPPSDHRPFDFLKQVGSSAAFANGSWSVQLDFFGMSANDAGLLLRDITVRRYDSSGSLLESQALAAGAVMTLPSGATRISLTNAVSGWSSGSATDFLGLQFYLQNDGASAEHYSIRAGVDEGDWGASWLSQPK